MTQLEIILIIIIWVTYGLYSLRNTKFLAEEWKEDFEDMEFRVFLMSLLYIVFSPILFILKCLYGAFKKYE